MRGEGRRFFGKWDPDDWMWIWLMLAIFLVVSGIIFALVFSDYKSGQRGYDLKQQDVQICAHADDPSGCLEHQKIVDLCASQQKALEDNKAQTFDVQGCINRQGQ